ncbi:hypothetical protein JI62_11670 [Halomonas campaniensis]|uniref:Uncharacterized protein n=1 Tax=Halomonas campaniensis TaxID=213554 RepID=A0A246RZE5_9GAMM|nr:hypothetical protein JI62_11670 [Halomonas campaniensis]
MESHQWLLAIVLARIAAGNSVIKFLAVKTESIALMLVKLVLTRCMLRTGEMICRFALLLVANAMRIEWAQVFVKSTICECAEMDR